MSKLNELLIKLKNISEDVQQEILSNEDELLADINKMFEKVVKNCETSEMLLEKAFSLKEERTKI